ncbi:MAG: hypothetical protein ABJN69_08040 [Hellea sp.]
MQPKRRLSIRIAGNTQNPALNTLREKGYRVWIEPDDLNEEEPEFLDWNAEKEGRYFSATDPVELLGLVAMQECRGDDWQQKTDEPDIVCEVIEDCEKLESINALFKLTASGELTQKMGDAHVIENNNAMPDSISKGLPDNLHAFMWVRQPHHIDYYGFETQPETLTWSNSRVVVYADGITVQSWIDFRAFLKWLHQQ